MNVAAFLRNRRDQRRADAERRTLAVFRDGQRHFGYDLWKTTGLRTGRLYPALNQLYEQGLIHDGWETEHVGPLPRRWYQITPKGHMQATTQEQP